MVSWNRCQIVWAQSKHALSRFISFVSILIGITGGSAALFPVFFNNPPLHQVIQSIALALISILSLGMLAWREIVLGRRARLAGTLDRQRASSEKIRDLYSFLKNELVKAEGNNHEQALAIAKKILQDVLDEHAAIYSQMTSLRCRICIKVIANVECKEYVFALARDGLSASECQKDDRRRKEIRCDELKDNSFLMELFDDQRADQGFFLSNDLEREEGYTSTSLHYRQVVAGNSNRAIDKKWCLPYRSAIVVPIRQEPREDLGLAGAGEMLVGFIGIDAPSRGAFSRRWDIPPAKALANSLFPILQLYAELDSRRNEGGRADD